MGEKTSNTDLRLTMELVRDQNWLAETDVELAATKSVDLLDGSDVARIIDELLTLREATAPQMAEVDALVDPWVGQPFVEIIGTFRNMRYLARTAILACEKEKQRADNLQLERDGAVACMDSRLKEIESITDERDKLLEKIAAYECEEGV